MDCSSCGKPVVHIDAEVDPRAISLRLLATCGHEVAPQDARRLWNGGMRWALPSIDGASLLTAERHRQVHEEGFTPERDADLDANDLTWASWCLLDAAASDEPVTEAPRMWPEGVGEWKPDHVPMRRLVIAGAMVAAEIDRRLRESRVQQQ